MLVTKLFGNILKENLLRPNHIARVQNSLPNDYPLRMQYYQRILRKIVNNPNFSATVLFTDEANLLRDGSIHFYNNRKWSYENQHATVMYSTIPTNFFGQGLD